MNSKRKFEFIDLIKRSALCMTTAVLLHQGYVFASANLSDIEKSLNSQDPAVWRKGVEDFVQISPRADALAVMGFAGHLFNAGYREEALFWFYAGQLRARYMRELSGENSQILTILIMVSESINAYGMSDVARFRKVVQKVLEWDEETFDEWAWEQSAYFRDQDVAQRRNRARDGLMSLVKELESKRGEYEKQGREHLAAEDSKRTTGDQRALPPIPRQSLEPPGKRADAQRIGRQLYLYPEVGAAPAKNA